MSAISLGSLSRLGNFGPTAFLRRLNFDRSLSMYVRVGDFHQIQSIDRPNLKLIGFTGFLGQYTSSRKEPDAHIIPLSLDMPTVVVESGWSESRAQLHRDRDLWLIGGRVNVVIVIKWVENSSNEVAGDIAVFDLDSQGAVRCLQQQVTIFKSYLYLCKYVHPANISYNHR